MPQRKKDKPEKSDRQDKSVRRKLHLEDLVESRDLYLRSSE